jgi:hypothetical protein
MQDVGCQILPAISTDIYTKASRSCPWLVPGSMSIAFLWVMSTFIYSNHMVLMPGKSVDASSSAVQVQATNNQILCCAFNANGTVFVTGSSDTFARVCFLVIYCPLCASLILLGKVELPVLIRSVYFRFGVLARVVLRKMTNRIMR